MKHRSAFVVFRSVIFALMMRDIKVRFSDTRAGYFWAFMEPALHIFVLSGSYYALGKATIYNTDPVFFIMIGIIPWLIFREALIGSMNVMKESKGLFDYKQVKPIDAVVAKNLLNIFVYICVYLVFMVLFLWAGVVAPLDDPLKLITVITVLFFLGLASGIFLSVVSAIFSEVKRAVRAFVRPLYFVSGVFFTMEMIPDGIRKFLFWNPVFHAMDFIKDAHIKEYDSPASWEYLCGVTLVSLFVSLMYYRQNVTRMFLK